MPIKEGGAAAEAGVEQAIANAKADLAQSLDLPEQLISVESVEAVDWPDASLGCPLPGVTYAQVVTPGFLIVLEADESKYECHTDAGQQAVQCTEDGLPALPRIPVNPEEIKDGKPWIPADGEQP
jgi:hypothetical protein